jgi:hypothetical protein
VRRWRPGPRRRRTRRRRGAARAACRDRCARNTPAAGRHGAVAARSRIGGARATDARVQACNRRARVVFRVVATDTTATCSAVPQHARVRRSEQRLLERLRRGRGRRRRSFRHGSGWALLACVGAVQLGPQARRLGARRLQLRLQRRLLRLRRRGASAARYSSARPCEAMRSCDAPGAPTCRPAGATKRPG